MAKSKKRVSQHIGGIKENLLSERLKSTDLKKTMIVPIEIGKSSHKTLLADYFGCILEEPFRFHNSQEGVRFLDKTISKVSKEHQLEEVFVAMEATGHYYQWLVTDLLNLGYDNLFILNPFSSSQCRKAGLVWSKTDDIDLGAIGQALTCGYGSIYCPELPIWEDLKQLCRYRRFQVRRQTAIKNKIHALLDHLLPGISELEIFKDSHLWGSASLEFLAKHPNVSSISNLRSHQIVEFFNRRGRRLLPEDGFQLIKWTKETFNRPSVASPTREEILKFLILELKGLGEGIRQLEVKILGHLVQIPAVLLLSIDYIGPIRAAEFAGEITPFEQYPSSRVLIKRAGLDPTTSQSATQESNNHHVSKKGSRSLRYISIEIGDALMKHNEYFSHFAHRLMGRGKSQDCACIATAARFIRVAFWMIKDQRPFQPPNGLGVNKDPLAKIGLFLRERRASDRIEEYVSLAKRYFLS